MELSVSNLLQLHVEASLCFPEGKDAASSFAARAFLAESRYPTGAPEVGLPIFGMAPAAAQAFNLTLQAIFDRHKGFGDDSKLNSLALVCAVPQVLDHFMALINLHACAGRAGNKQGGQKQQHYGRGSTEVSMKCQGYFVWTDN